MKCMTAEVHTATPSARSKVLIKYAVVQTANCLAPNHTMRGFGGTSKTKAAQEATRGNESRSNMPARTGAEVQRSA